MYLAHTSGGASVLQEECLIPGCFRVNTQYAQIKSHIKIVLHAIFSPRNPKGSKWIGRWRAKRKKALNLAVRSKGRAFRSYLARVTRTLVRASS